MKKLFALILGLAMLLALTGCMELGSQQPNVTQPTEPPATQPAVGYQAGNLCPGYDLPIITGDGDTGSTVDPTKTGKVTVINFWGTWCGPCVSELPHLEELAESYRDTVTVIAVHSTQDARKAPAFIAENYPDSAIVFSWETGDDYNGEYYLMTGGEGYYPYTVVLDADGIVTETKIGGMTYAEMQEMVENAGAVQSPITETQPQAVTPSIPQAQIGDAYGFSQETSYGYTQCFHIPELILPDGKADQVNRVMYEELFPMVEEAENPVSEYADPILGMQYSMWQYGDVVSVVVSVMQPYNDYVEYWVYNVSAVTGEILSDEQVFSLFGLTDQQGRQTLIGYLDAYWGEHESDYGLELTQMIPFIEDTYSEDFLDTASVFAGPDGTVCFVAKIGVPAGAGHFNTLIDPDGQLFHIDCSIPGHDTY